jgi:pimeloyl-ACP methyl ester carboxylesterase
LHLLQTTQLLRRGDQPNLKQKLIIEGAGHWIQQERADEVNAALIAFAKGCVSEAQ